VFNFKHAALAVAASLTAAAPVTAAPVSLASPPPGRALLLIPLTLTKVQDIHFGTIIPSSTTAGFVTINATTGARTGVVHRSRYVSPRKKRLNPVDA